MLKYRGYFGCAKRDLEEQFFWGRIMFITDLVTFEGGTIEEIETEFKKSVDDYIKTCTKLKIKPQ